MYEGVVSMRGALRTSTFLLSVLSAGEAVLIPFLPLFFGYLGFTAPQTGVLLAARALCGLIAVATIAAWEAGRGGRHHGNALVPATIFLTAVGFCVLGLIPPQDVDGAAAFCENSRPLLGSASQDGVLILHQATGVALNNSTQLKEETAHTDEISITSPVTLKQALSVTVSNDLNSDKVVLTSSGVSQLATESHQHATEQQKSENAYKETSFVGVTGFEPGLPSHAAHDTAESINQSTKQPKAETLAAGIAIQTIPKQSFPLSDEVTKTLNVNDIVTTEWMARSTDFRTTVEVIQKSMKNDIGREFLLKTEAVGETKEMQDTSPKAAMMTEPVTITSKYTELISPEDKIQQAKFQQLGSALNVDTLEKTPVPTFSTLAQNYHSDVVTALMKMQTERLTSTWGKTPLALQTTAQRTGENQSSAAITVDRITSVPMVATRVHVVHPDVPMTTSGTTSSHSTKKVASTTQPLPTGTVAVVRVTTQGQAMSTQQDVSQLDRLTQAERGDSFTEIQSDVSRIGVPSATSISMSDAGDSGNSVPSISIPPEEGMATTPHPRVILKPNKKWQEWDSSDWNWDLLSNDEDEDEDNNDDGDDNENNENKSGLSTRYSPTELSERQSTSPADRRQGKVNTLPPPMDIFTRHKYHHSGNSRAEGESDGLNKHGWDLSTPLSVSGQARSRVDSGWDTTTPPPRLGPERSRYWWRETTTTTPPPRLGPELSRYWWRETTTTLPPRLGPERSRYWWRKTTTPPAKEKSQHWWQSSSGDSDSHRQMGGRVVDAWRSSAVGDGEEQDGLEVSAIDAWNHDQPSAPTLQPSHRWSGSSRSQSLRQQGSDMRSRHGGEAGDSDHGSWRQQGEEMWPATTASSGWFRDRRYKTGRKKRDAAEVSIVASGDPKTSNAVADAAMVAPRHEFVERLAGGHVDVLVVTAHEFVTRWSFIAALLSLGFGSLFLAPVRGILKESLYRHLDDRDCVEQYRAHRVWSLVAAAMAVVGICFLVDELPCVIVSVTTGVGRILAHFFAFFLLLGVAFVAALFGGAPWRESARRAGSDALRRVATAVVADGRSIAALAAAATAGCVESALQAFVFWRMRELGGTETSMGAVVAAMLLAQSPALCVVRPFACGVRGVRALAFAVACLGVKAAYLATLRTPWAAVAAELAWVPASTLWVVLEEFADEAKMSGLKIKVLLVYQAVYWGVGGAIGSGVAGLMYDYLGWSTLCGAMSAVAFTAAAILLILDRYLPTRRKPDYAALLLGYESGDEEVRQDGDGAAIDWLKAALHDEDIDNKRKLESAFKVVPAI
ncbi:PREDICTED: uncharacterized protein LOC106821242 [Priapulus caudatus]|uniref:Uncharacterized protein LOC106821242 n=1 Tax=Priapulus caudatus TaxID=37621 RepID=A0ABM1FAH3_PRICU|nr:PREDICTED: uncharacterized protein LOC106821242 [Priapulus caudatus]